MPAKILVVDDDPDILDAVTMILESQGYEVVTARDGTEGLDKLKVEHPDLMILDLMMPKMDGFDVVKYLQDSNGSKHKYIPIIILTSVREDASRRRYELETGLGLDVDDYLEKPMSPDVLLKKVSTLIKMKKS